MDITLKYNLVFLCLIVLIECVSTAVDQSNGHFRCTWHIEEPSNDSTQAIDAGPKSCNVDDTVRLTSYINHCTKQNYVPLLACKDTGEWNCESFLAMCKTIIRSDPTSAMSSRTTGVPRKGLPEPEHKPKAAQPVEPQVTAKHFNPNENYFTMKEMAVAVLVSFITGATVLALVIFVVWRWRNCHVDAEHRREEHGESMKHKETLQVLGHLAQAMGHNQDSNSNHKSFVNPNYGQMLTTRDILEDVINEQDRAYEEILTRRKSSCHPECIYAAVDKSRVPPTLIRTLSGTELKTIDESAVESDVGYDADINTPQTPRRFVKYLANAVYSVPRSPAVNETRRTFGAVDADMLRHSLKHLRHTKVENPEKSKNESNESAEDPGKILFTGESLPVESVVVDCNKSDSGYVEEMSELAAIEIKMDTVEQANNSDCVHKDGTERKSSLRL